MLNDGMLTYRQNMAHMDVKKKKKESSCSSELKQLLMILTEAEEMKSVKSIQKMADKNGFKKDTCLFCFTKEIKEIGQMQMTLTRICPPG